MFQSVTVYLNVIHNLNDYKQFCSHKMLKFVPNKKSIITVEYHSNSFCSKITFSLSISLSLPLPKKNTILHTTSISGYVCTYSLQWKHAAPAQGHHNHRRGWITNTLTLCFYKYVHLLEYVRTLLPIIQIYPTDLKSGFLFNT